MDDVGEALSPNSTASQLRGDGVDDGNVTGGLHQIRTVDTRTREADAESVDGERGITGLVQSSSILWPLVRKLDDQPFSLTL